jgi:hypothetical protein
VVFTNTRHESNHNQYPIKTTEQTAIPSFYFIFEYISVSYIILRKLPVFGIERALPVLALNMICVSPYFVFCVVFCGQFGIWHLQT